MSAAREPRRAASHALTLLLGVLSTLGPFSNDSVLPVFPSLQAELSASDLEMQQVLTAYFVPFAFMMLLHGMIVGSFLSARLAGWLSPAGTVFAAYVLMICAVGFNVAYHAHHPATLPVSVVPIFVYTIGMGTSMPSLMLLVLDLMPERRGFASSVIGFAQSGSSAVLAGGVSHWVSGSALSLAACSAVLLACAIACWLGYLARATALPRRSGA